jgi:hypothetical protein
MALRIPIVVINGRIRELPVGDQFPNEVLATYVHDQTVASDIWVIDHNMKKHPSVSVVLSDGTHVIGSIRYLSEDSLEIRFSKNILGKAYLN